MSDHEEEAPAVSSPQNVAGTPTVSVPQSTVAAGTSTVSASQNSTTEPATQAVQHSTSGPKDIRMQAFIADSDPDETGRRWKKWKNELLTRFRYFRISNTQDRIDALHIYRGEQIRELIESLESVPTPSSAELQNEYEKIIVKLDNHFIPMVNPECARSKLENMCQKEGESVAQYHVRLRLQVAKCGFTDPDDVIRSKILQTMRDKKLRREAMVKRYTLQQLLEHAANKEDIDRQAQDMEQKLALVPPVEKHVPCAQKKVILLACVKTKRTRRTLHRSHGQPQSTSRKRNRRNHPIRISPSRSE